jgi:hypothetical protein
LNSILVISDTADILVPLWWTCAVDLDLQDVIRLLAPLGPNLSNSASVVVRQRHFDRITNVAKRLDRSRGVLLIYLTLIYITRPM